MKLYASSIIFISTPIIKIVGVDSWRRSLKNLGIGKVTLISGKRKAPCWHEFSAENLRRAESAIQLYLIQS